VYREKKNVPLSIIDEVHHGLLGSQVLNEFYPNFSELSLLALLVLQRLKKNPSVKCSNLNFSQNLKFRELVGRLCPMKKMLLEGSPL
jgi:hypothetical protein